MSSPQPCTRFNGVIKKCAENLAQDFVLFLLCRFCVDGSSSGNPSFVLGNANDTSQFLECSKGQQYGTRCVAKVWQQLTGALGTLWL